MYIISNADWRKTAENALKVLAPYPKPLIFTERES
jgi:hypothetical protein